MLVPPLDGDPLELPFRYRMCASVVPFVFALLPVLVHPTPQLAAAAVVATLPWSLALPRVDLPVWLCSALPIGGAAWLMSAWHHTDLSLMLLVYLVGQQGVLLPLRGAIATWAFALAVPLVWGLGTGYDRAPAWLIGMTFAGVCGTTFRKQLETMRQLQLAQQELADKAVTDERRRIAREVHDVVAHSLAVTMLHLTGARLALADGEAAEAEAALAAAERLGRSSMTGIRQAVGLLTESVADPDWGPEPDLGDVPALIEDYRRAGVEIDMLTTGASRDLEPGVGLAVFRLVQESLANAVRHAPGRPVRVRFDWAAAALGITVDNPVDVPSVPAPSGHGLIGMRERVEQLGGSLSAGLSGSVWRVHAHLPLAVDAEAGTR